MISIPLIEVQNVGFDYTGRSKDGNELSGVANLLKQTDQSAGHPQNLRVLPQLSKEETFVDFAFSKALTRQTKGHHKLGDYVELATTGRTPARSDYSSEGLFLVKVGNLTGSGIRWLARERNFISGKAADKIRQNPKLMLRVGDILLTASAHSPIYIAKKVDVVARIPDWIGNEASLVGETMMLRPNQGVDSYHLLAFLRQPQTMQEIQRLIRGQTAHLHASDLLLLEAPSPLAINGDIGLLGDILRTQAQLNEALNDSIHAEQNHTTPECDFTLSPVSTS